MVDKSNRCLVCDRGRGNLKVTGTVDANGNPITNVGTALSMTDAINGNVLQSALRDDGIYEYNIFV